MYIIPSMAAHAGRHCQGKLLQKPVHYSVTNAGARGKEGELQGLK